MMRMPAVVALFIWASVSAAAAATCPAPAVQPDSAKPLYRAEAYNRFAGRLNYIDQRARSGSFAAVAIGDSGLQLWPDEMLQEAMGMKTLNAGIAGDTAAAVLWRLQNGVWPTGARYVFILVGSNDGGRYPPCEVFFGIRAVVAEAHRVFPQARILVNSIMPRGVNMSARDTQIRLTNAALSESAADDGYTFVDAHDAFLCDHKSECDLVRADHVHPTPKGYQVLGDVLRRTMQGMK